MAKEKKRGKRRFWRVILWLAILGVAASAAAIGGFFIYGSSAWGEFDRSRLESFEQSTFLYDSEDNMYRSLYRTENRVNIEIETLPKMVVNAFLAAEDLRFYEHFGIDVIRMFGALAHDIRTLSFSHGASTITQQLVKLTHLTLERKVERKLQEIYYAIQVERAYTKDEILELYLNYINFGGGAYGIEAAAKRYFGVSAADLTLAQAATLAAAIKAPSNYAPHLQPERNIQRRDYIITTMLENKLITQAQADTALNTPLALSDSVSRESGEWFTDEAISQAVALLKIDQTELITGGYHIYTTLDPLAQRAFDAAAADSEVMPEDQNGEKAQCAMVMMAKDGAVLALTGGREYTAQKALSRATSALRQPGSALKPLAVYAPAIERLGIQTVTYFNDTPTDFGGYSPGNFNGRYYGYVTLREVFERSLNVPAVSILNQMGVETSRDYLTRLDIPLDPADIYLPLALGAMTYGVTPYNLCGAYLSIINDGMTPEPYIIRKITDSSGTVIYQHSGEAGFAMSPSTAYIIGDMMQSTAKKGSAQRLSALGYPVGAKTGTVGFSNIGNRDAWCAAITPERAMVTWIGFDQTTEKTHLPNSVTGSNTPTQIILDILAEYLPEGDGDFSKPGDVISLEIDKKTLQETGVAYLATDITPAEYRLGEVFTVSNRPVTPSPYWQIPDAPYDLQVISGTDRLPLVSFTSRSDAARYLIYRDSGGEPSLIAIVQSQPAGTSVAYLDESAERGVTYSYKVVAQHALAADYGMTADSKPSYSVSYFVPQWVLPEWFNRW